MTDSEKTDAERDTDLHPAAYLATMPKAVQVELVELVHTIADMSAFEKNIAAEHALKLSQSLRGTDGKPHSPAMVAQANLGLLILAIRDISQPPDPTRSE